MYKENLKYIKDKLKDNFDIQYREVFCKNGLVTIIFSENISDNMFISEYIIKPVMSTNIECSDINTVKTKILQTNNVSDTNSLDDALIHILSGDVIILFECLEGMIYCDAKKTVQRAVDKPLNDPVIKGSQEGFNESLNMNIGLIRKRIRNTKLKILYFEVGKESNTSVAMAYIEGKAEGSLVNTIKEKISNLNVQFILDTNYIEEELKNKGTELDTIGYTEKPDIVVSRLFEGRVAVLVDGCPTALTAPCFFIEYFQAPDDYYLNKNVVDVLRIFRIMSFLITITLPAFYVALFTHHFSLIPPTFVFKISEARAGVPFPTIVEVIIILFFFELAREAGKRLPSNIGQPLSIVSALILGDAAIGAGLASQGTIIIMGVYAITSYINPKILTVTPIWSMINVIMCGLFGLHGFYIFFIVVIAHIGSLDSCGYKYFWPFGTVHSYSFKHKDYLTRGRLSNISDSIFRRKEK
ncbi:spore germination protein [Clostridium fungisolvens]|uniref:Spore germination protein A1 n=1 Tax=Clostridium fungisolvens TaxID=1604897 RepID=A0A6V8SJJ2_9CLOT|nr:spore germination protein [Clostridium fungisolvens]GFP75073.1 Spore germination protein A1 [Clostridium fungisolvens]